MQNINSQNKNSGFSLVELLVVIVIIGLLATFTVIALNTSRIKARDSQRVAYINQINSALELYYLKNNVYPTLITVGQTIAFNNVKYLSQVPSNPAPRNDGNCPNQDFAYAVQPGNTSYTLSFCLGGAAGNFSSGTTICDGAGRCRPCGTYTLSYGGVTYNTVVVGTQCWLDKNLNYGTMLATGGTAMTNNGIVEKYCPLAHGSLRTTPLSESDCTTWGAVYNWSEAMNYQASECNNGKCQGICPAGWHIPTEAELGILETYLTDSGQTCLQTRLNTEGCSTAGTKLKSGGSSGLNFPRSGYLCCGGDWYYRGTYGDIWSSTAYSSDYAYKRRLSSLATVNRYYHDKGGVISMRCIKN